MKKILSHFIIIIILSLILSCGPKLIPYGEWEVLVDETGIPVDSLLTPSGNNSVISIGGSVYFDEFGEHRLSNEVWKFEPISNEWSQMNPAGDEFPVIFQSAAVYGGVVSNHNKVVVFGGFLITYPNEIKRDNLIRDNTDRTWEYDVEDNSWSETTKSVTPGSKYNHAISYMKDNEILLFSGTSDDYGDRNDTWIYNTNTSSWEEVNIEGDKPCFRIYHEMVSNEKDTVVLFGGANNDLMFLNDTWEFSISDRTWTKIDTRTKPPRRWFFDMTYIGDNKIIIFGGDVAVYHDSNDMWIYDIDEKNWQQVEIVGENIRERRLFNMVTTSGGITILHGGINHDAAIYFDQTYQFTLLGYE